MADYVSVGGVFATTSKHNPGPPIGLDGMGALIGRLPTCRCAPSRESTTATPPTSLPPVPMAWR
jgi:hypothetical protein